MCDADGTIFAMAAAAGLSAPTFDATHGHLVRGDIAGALIRPASPIDYRTPPPAMPYSRGADLRHRITDIEVKSTACALDSVVLIGLVQIGPLDC